MSAGVEQPLDKARLQHVQFVNYVPMLPQFILSFTMSLKDVAMNVQSQQVVAKYHVFHCRYKQYTEKVAETPEAFQENLDAFYNSMGKTVSVPTVDKQPLDLYGIFKTVASLGGYESVTFNR